MQENQENTKYNIFSKCLHWAMALIIMGLILMGFFMEGLAPNPFKFEIYGLHKSFGLLILWLVFIRILWRFYSKPVLSLPTHKTWEKWLAKLAHFALYIAMIAMPLSGWVMSSAGGHPVSFFGIQMPDILEKNPELSGLANQTHAIIAYIFVLVITLHILGALKHHFIDKDITLNRMLLSQSKIIIGILVIIFVLFLGGLFKLLVLDRLAIENEKAKEIVSNSLQEKSSEIASKDKWIIQSDLSRIDFTANVYNKEFQGSFENFSGDIVFNRNDLENASAKIMIDLKSVETGDAERNSQMMGEEWFKVSSSPFAKFESITIEKASQNYIVIGNLSLAGKTMPLNIPFQLDIVEQGQSKRAYMNATFTLNRLDYDLGGVEWQSADLVGHNVDMSVVVVAQLQ